MNGRFWSTILVLILLVGIGGFFWFRGESTPPALEGPPDELVVGRDGVRVELRVSDLDSGLRSVRAAIAEPSGERVLLEESYPGNLLSGGVRKEHTASVELDAQGLANLQSPAFLRLSVSDWSLRGWLAGNQTQRDVALRVDLEPPRIDVHSGLTYVKQGGSGSVAYRLAEPTAKDGVQVGEVVFRGFPAPGGAPGERIALFAFPADADPNAAVRVFAVDAAGNRSEAGWSVVVQARPQPEASVQLSDPFLATVLPRLAPQGTTADPATAFHDVNTRVRSENEARIRELIANGAAEPLFRERFHQLANSKVTSRFGERRSYQLKGREISRAVHYGYDLASFAAAPITATAAGRVRFAGDLGIYGNCILIDHGLGLATLYGHLSRLDVAAGAQVEADQVLGLSGSTGLAGGDHLHFAVLLGDTYVDPLEWWDAEWVATHVASNLRLPAS